MLKNVGGLDRVIRFVLGLGILGAGIYFKSWWGALGVLPLGTAVFSVCPAYLPFGLSSRSAKPGPRA